MRRPADPDELQALIGELVWVLHLWACEEDNQVYDAAWATFREAIRVAGIPVTITTEDGDTKYRFDHDWAALQRLTWAMRQDDDRRQRGG